MATKEKKKTSTLGAALRRMLGMKPKAELSFQEEEALQSPIRVIVRNFAHKKTAMFGLIVFVIIFIIMMVGPLLLPIDLGYSDSSLVNVAPGYDMMDVPKELIRNGVRAIAPGTTYGLGVDDNGKVYVWGKTRISESIDLADIPEKVQEAEIIDISAGSDHVVALSADGQLFVWGNDRLGQADFKSSDLYQELRQGETVVQLDASNQFSAILFENGNMYLWGNSNNADIKMRSKEKLPEDSTEEPRQFQGNVAKFALTDYGYVILLKDGTVAYAGYSNDAPLLTLMPEALTDGSVNVIDIVATSQGVAAVDDNGQVYVWGNATHGEKDVPELDGKIVELYAGRYHLTALLDNGDVVSWGDDMFGQSSVPDKVNKAEIETIYAGAHQNYAVTTDGRVLTWGLKGYLFGTDELGRDILTRIVNGGKTTMTVGGLAVIISTIIGIVLGGMAGYFGGKVDMIMSRVAEVIGGLPFLPFALILSNVMGTRVDPNAKMYIIMVVLGVLSWVGTFRLVRAQIFSQREQEYVTAAKCLGVRESTIVLKHIIPNVMSVLLVSVTLNFATCMLTESTLSYLGFGIPLPQPTWGNMLNGANNSIVIQQYWWRWVFTAGIFGLTTICINLIGDGMRDAMDPKNNSR